MIEIAEARINSLLPARQTDPVSHVEAAPPSKIGPLPRGEELALDAEHPEAQPRNPGVIVYTTDVLKEGVCVCTCTRNLRAAEKRIDTVGGHIVYSYPVHEREGQGRRLGRYIRKSVSEIVGNSTTFYFKINDGVRGLFKAIDTKDKSDYKAVRQALKATVRKAICDIANKTQRATMSVKDVVTVTLQHVDGMSIEMYLNWLIEDGVIKYTWFAPLVFDRRIKLIQ